MRGDFVDAILYRRTGTEVALTYTSKWLVCCTAHSTCPLEVHPPMAQRVYALTFLRYTCPRRGGRFCLGDGSMPLWN